MPIVAHNKLPTFARLQKEGSIVLSPERAQEQDIRELHVGLLNMMPDAALGATERQFFRLIGESNPIAQFYIHPFTLPELERGPEAAAHIKEYYESVEQIKEGGLDALIITGANVTGQRLDNQTFWEPLIEIIDWAAEHVTSTLCSCLATHAVLQFRYQQHRQLQKKKIWGVFSHQVIDKTHPLVVDINTRFDVPHSRWNQVSQEQFEDAGLRVLVRSDDGVHLATSGDGLRFVFFQGHPEYDTISLLKEYKREVGHYAQGKRQDFPPFPENYLKQKDQSILIEYRSRLDQAKAKAGGDLPEFPEALLAARLDNTWHDTAEAVIGNWVGLIYQITNRDRRLPFMDGIDPQDPLANI